MLMTTKTQAAPQEKPHYITAEQYDNHLCELLGFRKGSAVRDSLRLVLVDGLSVKDALLQTQVHKTNFYRKLREAKKCMGHVAALSYPAVRIP